MNGPLMDVRQRGLVLKEPAGWFAAGASFRLALGRLSDGAFKLFAYLCLAADRQTAGCSATHEELAAVLGKSRRSVIKYLTELQQRGVCRICPAKNQYCRTRLEICEEFWPYQRSHEVAAMESPDDYITAVREAFLALGCTQAAFTQAHQKAALKLKDRGLPLSTVLDALLLGASRKYLSWLNGNPSELIATLQYFEPLIEEVQRQPLAEDYRAYLRYKNRQMSELWKVHQAGRQHPEKNAALNMPGTERVQ